MTQYEQAKAGNITPQMRRVAQRENVSPQFIRDELAAGRLVIPANRVHLQGTGAGALDPGGIGRGVTTKINANIGASPVSSCPDQERVKLDWAVRYGADAVMDLSTGGDLDATREFLIAGSSVPIGTVPIYSMIVNKPIEELTHQDILATIRKQAAQGRGLFHHSRGHFAAVAAAGDQAEAGHRLARRQSAGQVDGPPQPRKPDV
jgi:phosphomethylpyrimidine synthase